MLTLISSERIIVSASPSSGSNNFDSYANFFSTKLVCGCIPASSMPLSIPTEGALMEFEDDASRLCQAIGNIAEVRALGNMRKRRLAFKDQLLRNESSQELSESDGPGKPQVYLK